MIRPESFSLEHIEHLSSERKVDKVLLERSIYAFGLLEALARVELPFIFKGGTSLMLLLESPKRLSTDIDIVVPPGTEVGEYIEKASRILPFKDFRIQTRKHVNNIEKCHYRFLYDSPVNGREFHILLDILYEENNYERLMEKAIDNEILIAEPPYALISVPTVDCILGDKLTAFAPHTTGIRFGEGKDLEIVKQMFDVSCLFDAMKDFEDVLKTYYRTVSAEIAYRGIEICAEDALVDTIDSAACIVGRGKVGTEYKLYASVMNGLSNHIYDGKFSGEVAAVLACKVIYIAACVLKGCAPEKIVDPNQLIGEDIGNSRFGRLSYIRKYNAEAFGYLVKASRILPI